MMATTDTDIDGLPLGPRSPRLRLAGTDRRRLPDSALNHPRSHPRAREIDELSYRAEVLSLIGDSTEEDIDQALHKEARDLGLVTTDQLLWDSKLRAQRLSQIRVSAVSNLTSGSSGSITSAPALSRSPSTDASRSTTVPTPRTSHDRIDRQTEVHQTDAPSAGLETLEPIPGLKPSRLAMLRSGKNLSVRDESPSGEYQRFLNQATDTKGKSAKKLKTPVSDRSTSAHSVFSNASRRSIASLKSSFSRMTRSAKLEPKLPVVACSTCEVSWPAPTTTEFNCGHVQCHSCVRDMILQAVRDKTKLPPKCCNTVIPVSALKNVLTADEQLRLVKAVLSLPPMTVEDRLYCPNINFPEHIPLKLLKVNVRNPMEASCEKCKMRICRTCKQSPHQQHELCPIDWPMLSINYLCEDQAWRRCHRCRKINELQPGHAFVACDCKAKTCAKCSAVYDVIVGCPNMCNGEKANWQQRLEEMETRKIEAAKEAARKAIEEDARSLQLLEATRRSQENQHLRRLRQQQLVERDRFVEYEDSQSGILTKRHAEARRKIVIENDNRERLGEQKQNLASNVMEERHIAVEMSLQETLAQEKRSCDLRLRHMEAYCHGLTTRGEPSPRVVTEQDLRELGRQYHLRDDMDRLHESKIGVLRTRQAKTLEALLERQELAAEQERGKRERLLAELEQSHLDEEQELLTVMRERMLRLVTRWEQQEAILRKKLEKQTGKTYGKLGEIPWPRGMSIDGRTGSAGACSLTSNKIWF